MNTILGRHHLNEYKTPSYAMLEWGLKFTCTLPSRIAFVFNILPFLFKHISSVISSLLIQVQRRGKLTSRSAPFIQYPYQMSNIVIQFVSEMYNCTTQNRKSFLPLRASGSDTCFVFSICRCLIKIMRFMLRRQHPELLMKLLRKICIGCWSLITTLSLILDRFTKLKVLGVGAHLKHPQKWMQSFVFAMLFSILQGQIIIRAACLMCGMV